MAKKDGVIVSLGAQLKAVYQRRAGEVTFVAAVDAKAGSVVKVPDGRAGVFLSDVTKGHTCVASVAGVFVLAIEDESKYVPGDKVFWDVESQARAESGLEVGAVIEAPAKGKHRVMVELNLLSLSEKRK